MARRLFWYADGRGEWREVDETERPRPEAWGYGGDDGYVTRPWWDVPEWPPLPRQYFAGFAAADPRALDDYRCTVRRFERVDYGYSDDFIGPRIPAIYIEVTR